MAALSTLKRIARLCGWVALSSGAMVAAACGAMVNAACSSSSPNVGAPPDAGIRSDADAAQPLPSPDGSPAHDATPGEANAVDADKADLWNVICE